MASLLEVLRCPRTGQKLRGEGGRLVTEDGKFAYRIEGGIPVLLSEEAVEAKS
ncbi:MAG: Trm112 family protein [Chthoniobacterales bacterium]